MPKSKLNIGSISEIAEMFNVSRQVVGNRARHGKLPPPIAELKMGPIWNLDEVEQLRDIMVVDKRLQKKEE